MSDDNSHPLESNGPDSEGPVPIGPERAADAAQAHEESRLAELLRRIDADPLAPDAAQLQALRERSLAAFAQSATTAETDSATDHHGAISMNTPIAARPSVITPHTRSLKSRSFALRGGAALLATAAAVLLAWSFWPADSVGAPTFAKVLAHLRDAETLELRVIKPHESAEVWVRAPGLVRWQDSPERYRISAGSRLWKIDETANTVTTGDSPWFTNPQEQIDLLGLLELGVSDATPLLKSRASEEIAYAGRPCKVYRALTPTADQDLLIEAFADVETGQLAGVIARRKGAQPDAPPLAELQLVAINPKVDESKFVVAKSLTEDGRIGAVADAQGVVTLRPMLAQRWTPICRETLLKTGDWLRTDIRGANAVRVRLSSDVDLTLGPGTLVECVSPTQARLHTGEAQVTLAAGVKHAFELLAPRAGAEQVAAGAKQLWRVAKDEKLVEVKQPPLWLTGFEGTTNNESLGSLIVKLPDGRNEPLSVGYHKVNVEIRDQIARTTIEESFVNHTDARLEGVFHFPLPQDASISGFGMWIGNDLVEADVVEKQRAREIFETILRENRDPGLLEWTSGNLFKARVFPIEAHSEKRVKIVYTQVLPLRANRYRYTYGLRSDLLRTRPVRELALTVTVNSARALRSVTCPTHSTRNEQTPHAARVEFAAQEYTPDRDFEVVCEVDGRGGDVIMIPHARGDDGYFLVQLSPPSREGNFQRDTLPDGEPLSLVLLCDTSASMDAEKRRQQAEFVATVLASLAEKDRFLLCAADFEPVWASAESQLATPENITKARAFLDDRVSLGWTDLDRAFAGVLEKSPVGAQVIYIGDGMVTTGDADPVAFVRRLQEISAKANPPGQPRTRWLNAVTVGNANETIVLDGIASAGGGSVRAISGERTPQAVAQELLSEIAEPGLRELQVEFRGVQVAAVYPERLPNVAAGTQQILVGRYLATGKDQQGEVIVSGLLGNEPVRYTAKIDLREAESGNSFIPRLWARGHLDHLLRQGTSSTIRDEIIGLSEEYHIITPYTSLLVLETDADRERFGVKRRYEMRDGERFFAAGKAEAMFDLRQAQIKRAGDWRVGLRKKVLGELATLARTAPQRPQQRGDWGFKARRGPVDYLYATEGIEKAERGLYDYNIFNGPAPVSGQGNGNTYFIDLGRGESPDREIAYTIAKPLYDVDEDGDVGRSVSPYWLQDDVGYTPPDARLKLNNETQTGRLMLGVGVNSNSRLNGNGIIDETISNQFESLVQRTSEYDAADFENMQLDHYQHGGERSKDKMPRIIIQGEEEIDRTGDLDDQIDFMADRGVRGAIRPTGFYDGAALGDRLTDLDGRYGYANDEPSSRLDRTGIRHSGRWLDQLLPSLAPSADKLVAPKDPPHWPAEAIALSNSLVRTESLARMTGGVELRRTAETFDPAWKRRSSHSVDLLLYSPANWMTRPVDSEQGLIVNYCDARQRGVYSLGTLLGRARAAYRQDLSKLPIAVDDWSLAPLHWGYWHYIARLEPAEANQVRLILKYKWSTHEVHFLIDTARRVALRRETFFDGKSTGVLTYSNFVEVAGSWWAGRQTTADERGRKTAETVLEVKALAPEPFTARLNEELAVRPKALLIQLPLVKLDEARQKRADGSADVNDQIRLLLEACRIEKWDDALTAVDAMEKVAADRPGLRWIRTLLLQVARRNEDARQRLLTDARALAATPAVDEVALAGLILSHAGGLTSPNEYLEFVELLKPVFVRQAAETGAMRRWQGHLLGAYRGLGHTKEVLELTKTLAEATPWDAWVQVNYADDLAQRGDFDQAYAWLQAQLDQPIERDDASDTILRTAYVGLYKRQSRWADWLRFSTAWIERKPHSQEPYQQHLLALIYNDRIADANGLAELWLKEARAEEPLSPDRRARLDAAIAFAKGNGRQPSFEYTERWAGPLVETAKFFLNSKRPRDLPVAQQIYQSPFPESEAWERLRGYFLKTLQDDVATLSPAQITAIIGWTMQSRIELVAPLAGRTQYDASEIPDEVWRGIADKLHERWQKTEDTADKRALGESLRTIYARRFVAESLPFLREQLAAATAEEKPQYLLDLYRAIIAQSWTEAVETEAFALLPTLYDNVPSADRLAAEAQELVSLVDRMLAARQTRSEQELQDQGKTNELTRTELQAKRVEAKRAAQSAVAARLNDLATKDQGPLRPWLQIEWTYLQMQLAEHAPEVAEICWQILGETPKSNTPDLKELAEKLEPKPVAGMAKEEPDWEPLRVAMRQRMNDSLLRRRALTTVMNLATRRDAAPAAVARLSQYIDAGIADGEVAGQRGRGAKFQLLIALDKPDELERELRGWIRTDASVSPWRKPLALLLAERGKLDEAVQLFEAAEKDKLLTAADYATLANWYLARDQRAEYERARWEIFSQQPEEQLARRLQTVSNRWQSNQAPLATELDEDTLLTCRVLFKKSVQPEHYLHYVSELYASCHDFRLLEMLPDLLIGRSPQQAYTLLENMRYRIIERVLNEATSDEIVARIVQLRQGELSTVDLRALDLFEALVQRRASDVKNQSDPHAAACLAAMRRAFEREWSEGEPPLMASFLTNLGKFAHEDLKAEQLAEIRALRDKAPADSSERLQMTSQLCHLLFYSYQQREQALDDFDAAVRAYLVAHNGAWPQEDFEMLRSYVAMLSSAGRFMAAESVWQQQAPQAQNDSQRARIEDELGNLYFACLNADGTVSLGSGSTLFARMISRYEKQLAAARDDSARYNIASHLSSALSIAKQHKLAGVQEQTRKFAFETLPAVLRLQQDQYRQTLQGAAWVVDDILPDELALRFLVERMEQYPERITITSQNAWLTLGDVLAKRRFRGDRREVLPAELDARSVKLALATLQERLRNRVHPGSVFTVNSSYFWSDKAEDFARAAIGVYQERKSSSERAMAVSGYLHDGLKADARAIEILFLADREQALGAEGKARLVEYLHQANRYAESIPLLEGLVATAPDVMAHRTQLMTAYDSTQRPQQLQELLTATVAHFHQHGLWTEANLGALAAACASSKLDEQAAGYFDEAISLRQRQYPQYTGNDDTLSRLYQQLAHVRSRMEQTKLAVDAALGGIVSQSSRDQSRRADASRALERVLAAAKDLDDFVRATDEQVAKTGQDTPVLRKAIGRAYQGHTLYPQAIQQLQLAANLQPEDKEIHEWLIECYDASGQPAGAINELLAIANADRRDPRVYERLTSRLANNAAEAERAATSIVEAAPAEAETHITLARLRAKQERWEDAIVQWEQAARLRALEPTGLIGLAQAQISAKHSDAAQETIKRLRATQWPARFNNVANEIAELEQQLAK